MDLDDTRALYGWVSARWPKSVLFSFLTVRAQLRKWQDKLDKSIYDNSLCHASHLLTCGKWNAGW